MFKRASPFLCWDWMKDFLLQRLFLLNRRQPPPCGLSYFIIIFTLFSPIFTIATLPGCRAVLMVAEPFSLTAEPALVPLMLYTLTCSPSLQPCTLIVPPSPCISTALAGMSATPLMMPSSINTKSFHPSVALYLSIVPFGTYNVASLKVFWEKVL